jgi:hypothetical protein
MKQLVDEPNRKSFALAFEPDEEIAVGLEQFAYHHGITAAHFSAIGAFRGVVLGFFDLQVKNYRRILLQEQVELLSLVGNIALHQGKPKVHAHVVVGRADGTAHGGHLLEGYVRPTVEVVLQESDKNLQRRTDPETGLPLLDLDSP